MTNNKKKPTSSTAGAPASAGRRHAGIAVTGLLPLIVFGGISWAATNAVSGPAEPAQSAVAGALQASDQSPARTAPAKTGSPSPTAVPGLAIAPGPNPAAPEDPPLKEAPPAVDPAPVDRKDRSEKQLAEIPQPVASPVKLNAKKAVKTGVLAAISELEAVQGEARGIGEIAGPALRFKLTVTNDSNKELSLTSALVNVTFGADETPAGELSGPGTAAFPASVAPGGSAEAVYVFSVPADARDDVGIYFNMEAETPIAAFAGKAPA